ncbi:hypothetical protein F183_A21580 [Bryobacterales bacterium F-183]|nr:hypothetical protein F183_A21580 [Bryobacterales bacterium F-183]
MVRTLIPAALLLSLQAAECPAILLEARALLDSQQIPAALVVAEKCLATEPLNRQALLLKGNLLYLSGRDSDAIATLRDLVQREPTNNDARYALGRIYYFGSRPEAALEQFQAIVNKEPRHYRAWDNLGLALDATGKPEDAIKAHLRAIDLVANEHKEYDTVYANLADLLIKQNENRQAFNFAVEAAQRNPRVARNYFLAGKALTRLDQWAKSERWLLKAAELDTADPAPHYLLAQVYQRAGEQAKASLERKIFKDLQDKAPDKKR